MESIAIPPKKIKKQKRGRMKSTAIPPKKLKKQKRGRMKSTAIPPKKLALETIFICFRNRERSIKYLNKHLKIKNQINT